MMNDDNGRDVQEDDGNTIDGLIYNNDMPNEYIEQSPPKLLVEPQLRRSIGEYQHSRRYFSYKYVMITNGKEVECYQEAINYKQKKRVVKSHAIKDKILT